MELSTIAFEEFRKLQNEIRAYVEKEIFTLNPEIRLENLEKLSINEIIRNLLENYYGELEDFNLKSVKGNKEKFKKYLRSCDVYDDAIVLFLLNYGITPDDYYNHRNEERFKQKFREYREECLRI